MRPRPQNLGRRRRGAILLAILGFLVLTAFLVTAILREAADRLRYHGLFFNRDELRVEAYSALEATLAHLAELREIDGRLWGPAQGWNGALDRLEWPYPGAKPTVAVEDEAGRFSLANASREVWIAFFEDAGARASDYEAFLDSLQDWTDEDDLTRLNGAEREDYERLEPPYAPANGPVRSLAELRFIHGAAPLLFSADGAPTELFGRLRETFSLDHTGAVNLNTAGPAVLAVLGRLEGFYTEAVTEFLAGADRVPGTADDRVLRDPADLATLRQPGAAGEGSLAGQEAGVLRVTVTVSEGEAAFRLIAWVRPGGSSAGGAGGGEPGVQRGRDGQPLEGQPRVKTEVSGSGAAGGSVPYPFTLLRLRENLDP